MVLTKNVWRFFSFLKISWNLKQKINESLSNFKTLSFLLFLNYIHLSFMKGYFLFGNDIKINGFFRKQLNLPLIVKNFQLYRQAWTTQCKVDPAHFILCNKCSLARSNEPQVIRKRNPRKYTRLPNKTGIGRLKHFKSF